MARSYEVKVLVEILVDDQDDWDEFEASLEDSYLWLASHDSRVTSPYVISASIDSWVETS